MGGSLGLQPVVFGKVAFAVITDGYCEEVVCRGEDGALHLSATGVAGAA